MLARPHAAALLNAMSRPLLPRKRLFATIESPYLASITTIVAGAGFGKTTLAHQWAEESPRLVHWIDLKHDGQSTAHIVARLREIGDVPSPAAANGSRGSNGFAHDTARLQALLAGVADTGQSVGLVVDNGEALCDADDVPFLNALIDHLPNNVALLVVSRRPLPLRLGRLRSHGRVRDLKADDLRFTEQESANLLASMPGVRLTALQARCLWAFTHGWVAGMTLAMATMDHAASEMGSAQDWRPTWERFLDAYVAEEILDPLPDSLRRFAFDAAHLPFFSPDLCDTVLHLPDSSVMVRQLAQHLASFGHFDEETTRFHLDPPLAASLKRHAAAADPEPTDDRHAHAATWLMERGDLPAAADLALRSRDSALIVRVFEVLCRNLAERSALDALARWLDRVPEPVLMSSLHLSYWRIIARLGLGRASGAGELIEVLEHRRPVPVEPLHAGRSLLCRGILSYHAGHGAEAGQALETALLRLPEEAMVERMYASTFLGNLAFREAADESAAAVLGDAERYAMQLPHDEQWSWRVIAPDRANAYALRGDLYSAITKYRLLLSELPTHLGELEGFLRCRLVSLAIERGDLLTAAQELDRVDWLIRGEPRSWHHDAEIAHIRFLLASDEHDEAERRGSDYVKTLRRLPQKHQLELMLAAIWLEHGELPMVRSWLRDLGTPVYPWVHVFGDINPHFLVIDFDLAQGNFAQAAHTAQTMADTAEAALRRSEFIGFAVRSAIAQHELGNVAGGIEILRPALRAGAKGGFVRSFDVPGYNIVSKFKDLWCENRQVLEVRGNLQRLHEPDGENLSVMLTRREMEIVVLVSHGLSNKQIADRLFISVNTVRNHLVRVSRRFDASSRTEVVAKARQVGILD